MLASALRLANVTSDVINIIGVLLVLSVVSSSVLAWCRATRQAWKCRETPDNSSIPHATAGNNERKESHEVRQQAPHSRGGGGVSLAFAAAGWRWRRQRRWSRSGRRGLRSGRDANLTYLPKNLGNPYLTCLPRAAKWRSRSSAAPSRRCGPAEATPDAQVSYINTLTQQQVGAIVISANDKRAVMP